MPRGVKPSIFREAQEEKKECRQDEAWKEKRSGLVKLRRCRAEAEECDGPAEC